ncbi:MAG: Helix-turn-helix domain [Actinomycetota bacterium]|jgi:excisionase family DNA binding protein|nr:Helix-turn-helix domain [Actinomycetota bacterium]
MTGQTATRLDRLISDAQAAKIFGVSTTTVRRMRRDGQLATVRVRNLARIRESEVLALINRGGKR